MNTKRTLRTVILGGLLLGCGSDKITSQNIHFKMTLMPASPPAPSESPSRTETGWTVTLDQACIVVGPVRWVHHPEPSPHASIPLPRILHRLSTALLPFAHAHPGHEGSDHVEEVRGEWLGQIAWNILSKEPVVQSLQGFSGEIDSFSIGIGRFPAGSKAGPSCPGDLDAHVVGTATKEGAQPVPFEGKLDRKEAPLSAQHIPIHAVLQEGTHLTLQVRLQTWFAHAEFDQLTEQTPEGRYRITPGSQVYNEWIEALQSPDTFHGQEASSD